MQNHLNRRDVLKTAGLAAAGMLASPLLQWARAAEPGKTHKVLFFTRSQGFAHSVVTRDRNNPEKLAFAEQFVVDLGKEHGFEVTPTKDGSVFTEKGLEPYDVIMFYTTGRLDQPGKEGEPMPAEGKETFLRAIAAGKGFLGLHCATDTFHSGKEIDPYIAMIGGEFETHHSQENASILAADHDWAPLKGLQSFEKKEEWYILKNLAPDMHVLLIQDTQSMSQPEYKSIQPYPETWARMHDKGRVFYSSMGHRDDVWQSDQFKTVLLGGLNWVSGNIDAEVKPNLEQAAPGAMSRVRKSASA